MEAYDRVCYSQSIGMGGMLLSRRIPLSMEHELVRFLFIKLIFLVSLWPFLPPLSLPCLSILFIKPRTI